jgi:hypothetical protein
MPDSGVALGADLYDLKRVANRNFRTVINEFELAIGQIDNAAGQKGVLTRPDFFGGPTVERAWPEALERLRHMLTETSTSLDLTAQALLLAVARYAAADEGAARELSLEIMEKGDPTPDRPH